MGVYLDDAQICGDILRCVKKSKELWSNFMGGQRESECQFSMRLLLKIGFFNPTDTTRVAVSPRIGVGPGFDSQGSVNFFIKYCFPNLY